MFDFLEGKSMVIGWFPSCLSPTRSSFEGGYTQSIPTSWGGGLNSIVSKSMLVLRDFLKITRANLWVGHIMTPDLCARSCGQFKWGMGCEGC